MAKLAFVGLQQRLLSSVAAFARTLKVHNATLQRMLDGEEAGLVAAAALAFVEGPTSEDSAELGLEDDRAAKTIDADRADDRIGVFTGATGSDRREEVKRAFNADPDVEPLRILICTDAAREGINLQTYCSDLIHFDLPWNPSRLEQRNGRIDRKLQPAKQVICRYFRYERRGGGCHDDEFHRNADQGVA